MTGCPPGCQPGARGEYSRLPRGRALEWLPERDPFEPPPDGRACEPPPSFRRGWGALRFGPRRGASGALATVATTRAAGALAPVRAVDSCWSRRPRCAAGTPRRPRPHGAADNRWSSRSRSAGERQREEGSLLSVRSAGSTRPLDSWRRSVFQREPGRRLSAPAEGAGRAAVPRSPAALSVARGVYHGVVRWLCRGAPPRPSDRPADPAPPGPLVRESLAPSGPPEIRVGGAGARPVDPAGDGPAPRPARRRDRVCCRRPARVILRRSIFWLMARGAASPVPQAARVASGPRGPPSSPRGGCPGSIRSKPTRRRATSRPPRSP